MSDILNGFYYVLTWNFNALTDAEIEHNVMAIANALRPLGWSDNAIAGLCGNIQSEGQFNPGQGENSGHSLPDGDNYYFPYGLGLIQWTSGFDDYGNPNPNEMMKSAINSGHKWYDGRFQCEYMNTGEGYYSTSRWDVSFSEFKTWSGSPSDAASIWLYNRERPENPQASEATRRSRAERWFTFLTDHPYTPVIDSKLLVTIISHRIKNKTGKVVIK